MNRRTKMVSIRVPIEDYIFLRRLDAVRSRESRRPVGVGPLLLNLAKPGINALRKEGIPAPGVSDGD